MRIPSLNYTLFFVIAAGGWYLLPRRQKRLWLMAAGLAFYAFVDWHQLPFLIGAALVSYAAALAAETRWLGKRRLWTALGLVCLLGTLFVCKYFNFFYGSLFPGFEGLRLPLPPGLSFYCFGACAYLIDVQREKLPAQRSIVDLTAFLAFFPVLLAGPVGRAREFLPQLREPPTFDAARVRAGGMRFLRGMFKKLVVADTLGLLVDAAYADPTAVSGGAMLVAVLAYPLQIYLDFSGYSDMAIGCAEMLGLRVTENFKAPYLSRSIKEFWKKWHISLTDWFREYLYIPLGGSRMGKARTALNVLIVFAVSGLWHGAAWTFIVWGLLNGLYQVAGSLTLPKRTAVKARLRIPENGPLTVAAQGLLTFLLVTVAWIFFRSESLPQAVYVFKHILLIFRDGFGLWSAAALLPLRRWLLLIPVLLLCLWEDICISRGGRLPSERAVGLRYWGAAAALLLATAIFGVYGPGIDAREFVYFQF